MPVPSVHQAQAQSTMLELVAYCHKNNWAGFDPYDALNSRIFAALPLFNRRLFRLVLTQALKRSPINVRSLLFIPKTQNPKALALFLSAFLRITDSDLNDRETLVRQMIDCLISLRSPDPAYWNWGYSFPWQGRAVIVPAGSPNLVCTTFVAGALLSAYEQYNDLRCLKMTLSAADYILNELYWEKRGSACGFSYPLPQLDSETHNANLLASALLCRIYKHTNDKRFLDPALKATRYCVSKQRSDGSWFYGESPSQQWIDNFHTGYNLCALHAISRDLVTAEFAACIRHGFGFYKEHFFRDDGAAKYFHNRTYPIDTHSVAQSIITLVALKDLDPGNIELAQSVFNWAMRHLWDERGFFYYRVSRWCTIRTSYMRWSQAWMLLAISTLLEESTARESSKNHDVDELVRCS
jgi:hypothetical protein